MKIKVLYILMIIVFFIGSCKEDEVTYYNIGSETRVSSGDITSLDNSVTLKVNTFNVTEVTVKHLGGLLADGETAFTAPKENLGTITVSDNKGSLVVSDTDMGLTAVDMSADVMFTTIAKDGTPMHRPLTVTVSTPFTITKPSKVVQEADSVYLKFEIAPVSATVTGVTIQTKVFKSGTYATVAGTFNAEDSLGIKGSNYNIGDTIYVKITGSTATKSDYEVTKLVVGSAITSTVTVKLDTASLATMSYDLLKRRLLKTAKLGDSADVAFTQTEVLGGFTMGFKSNKNAEFVKLAAAVADSIYSLGNIVDISATDFTSAITADADVAVDDVFIFRTKRGTGAYSFGIFKIVTVAKPEGVKDDSYVEFELKY